MAMVFKKRHFSYPLRLLFVFIGILWGVMLTFLYLLEHKESKQDTGRIYAQLSLINDYIRICHENNKDIHLGNYGNFSKINLSDSRMENVYVALYDTAGNNIYTSASHPYSTDIKKLALALKSQNKNLTTHLDSVSKQTIFNVTSYSPKSKTITITEAAVGSSSLEGTRFNILLTIICMIVSTLIITLVSYLFFIHFKKNIQLLLNFANKMSIGESPNIPTEFSADELGDIAQNIAEIYHSKMTLVEEREKEREFAIAQEKNRLISKRAIANNLNHEIKTPIGIIQGYIETIINHPDIDIELRTKFLTKCVDNVERLQNMVYNLSLITRLEDGSKSIMMDNVDVYKSAQLVKDDLAITLHERNIVFNIKVKEGTCIKSNSSILYNLLNNLVKNSAMYSQGSRMTFELISKTPDFFIFSFYDNGIGVEDSQVPHLFERFYRIDKEKSRNMGGSGLGLAIVYDTIKIHHLCTIKAENRKGGGLMFTFSLPRVV